MVPDRPVVLFDGVCNLCNGIVQALIDRDPAGVFCFAALQSPAAATLLAGCGDAAGDPDTVLLIEGGRVYRRSTAVLRIARRLRFPFWLLYAFIVVPRPLRDLCYRHIARNRYRWFGRSAQCRLPTPELRARFLDAPGGP